MPPAFGRPAPRCASQRLLHDGSPERNLRKRANRYPHPMPVARARPARFARGCFPVWAVGHRDLWKTLAGRRGGCYHKASERKRAFRTGGFRAGTDQVP